MAYEQFPAEIWEIIIGYSSASGLRNMMLVSHTSHQLTKPYLYSTVHYHNLAGLETEVSHDPTDFLVTETAPYTPPHNSVEIRNLEHFRHLLDQQPVYRQYVKTASFSFTGVGHATNNLLQCLRLIEPEELHYRVPTTIGILSPDHMVSVDLIYQPRGFTLLRSHMHFVFTIPTVRRVCLWNVRDWQNFSTPPDPSWERTSNVTSITLLSTVPMDQDLCEILTWPKALLHYHHENKVIHNEGGTGSYRFPSSSANPASFIQALDCQKTTLESLYYDNVWHYRGTGDPFGTALAGFSELKSLSVHQVCLNRADNSFFQMRPAFKVLPSKIEILRIKLIGSMRDDDRHPYNQHLNAWLRQMVSVNRQKFPNLRKVTVMHSERVRERTIGGNQHLMELWDDLYVIQASLPAHDTDLIQQAHTASCRDSRRRVPVDPSM
jgi:hypothetical protein